MGAEVYSRPKNIGSGVRQEAKYLMVVYTYRIGDIIIIEAAEAKQKAKIK